MSAPEVHTPGTEARRWLARAEDDRRVVELALGADPPLPEMAEAA